MAQPSYDDELPVRWQPLSAEDLSPRALQRLQEDNIRLLRLFTLLDERSEPPAGDELSREYQQIQALDLKLNLALELLVDLLSEQAGDGEPTPVVLTTDTITWEVSGPAPPSGEAVLVALSLRRGFPKALQFPGRVTTVDPDTRRITVTFQALGEGFQDALTRFIFRHHRRAIHDGRRSD